MSTPSTTLRELTGMPATPASLRDSALVMIDLQNTYTRGVMALENVEPAIDEAAALLDRARSAGIPIVHVQHDAGEGTPYDVRDEIGAIVDRVAARDGEHRIVKNFPNSFVGTDLDEYLRGAGVDESGPRRVHDAHVRELDGPRRVQRRFLPVRRRRGHRDPRTARPRRHGFRREPPGGEPGGDQRHVRCRRSGQQGDPRLTSIVAAPRKIAPGDARHSTNSRLRK